MITRRGLLKICGGLVAAGFASSAYAVVFEPLLRLSVTTHRIVPSGWPEGLKLRLIALADIHACEPWMSTRRIKAICDHANTLDGDLIVLLGDYASGMNLVTDYVHSQDWARAMSGLSAPLGVHAILGNHDYWEDKTFQRDPSVETFGETALKAVGIRSTSTKRCHYKKTASVSGLPASAINWRCCPERASVGASSLVSTICPAPGPGDR